jgi:hypothetical protein
LINSDINAVITSTSLSPNTRNCLKIIAKVLTKINRGIFFEASIDTDITVFNHYIIEVIPEINKFYDNLIDVSLPHVLDELINNVIKGKDVSKYDYFKENYEELVNIQCICFSIQDILLLLKIVKPKLHNANYTEEILCCVDKNKKSPLYIAAKCGHTSLVSVLLSKGFSVHLRDKFLRTPLHIACQFGRGTVADVLIKSGSDLYARDSIGRTCLHYAACSDSIELVTLILGNDPEPVHSRDKYRRIPLHYAFGIVYRSNLNYKKFLTQNVKLMHLMNKM